MLIGDSCLDEYYYGVVERLSPEAPVPVLKIVRSESMPGMAANVAANLESFNCDVDFMTGGAKSIKKRFIDDRSKQHIVRVDEDKTSKPFNANLQSLELNQYDAIVISDYNKGFITYENVADVRRNYRGPMFMDTKKQDLAQLNGIYLKINETEYNQRYSINDTLIVTLGDRGAMYKQFYNEQFFTGAKVDVVDVCGAGDTFLAALSYQFLRTNSIEQAIMFANQCAAVAVTHQGVYSLSEEDIKKIDKV